MHKALEIMGLLNLVYLTNNLMNWVDQLNDFFVLIMIEWFLVWLPIYSIGILLEDIGKFLSKESYMKIHKDFWIMLVLYTQFFNKNVLMPQNVLIIPKSILPTYSLRKCFNNHIYNSSINIGSISFLSSSDIHQSHHLLGYHTTGINSSLNSFLSYLCFLNLICLTKTLFWLSKKSKQFAWQKSCSD